MKHRSPTRCCSRTHASLSDAVVAVAWEAGDLLYTVYVCVYVCACVREALLCVCLRVLSCA